VVGAERELCGPRGQAGLPGSWNGKRPRPYGPRAPDQVARIDLSRGAIVFLSDLKPESAVYTSWFGMDKELPARAEWFRPRQDQTLDSKPLRLAGKQYVKGLAVHGRTEMKYCLPGKFRKLEAIAGIDDEFRPRGSARLVLRGDDKVLLETAIAGADPPSPSTWT